MRRSVNLGSADAMAFAQQSSRSTGSRGASLQRGKAGERKAAGWAAYGGGGGAATVPMWEGPLAAAAPCLSAVDPPISARRRPGQSQEDAGRVWAALQGFRADRRRLAITCLVLQGCERGARRTSGGLFMPCQREHGLSCAASPHPTRHPVVGAAPRLDQRASDPAFSSTEPSPAARAG